MLTNLPHRISIQTLSVTEDEGGAFAETWTTTSTVWANVQMKASESWDDQKIQQNNFYDIIIRKADVSNRNRIVFGTKVIHIETVVDSIQRGKMMRIVGKCYE